MKKYGNCIISYIEEITSNVPEDTEDIEAKLKVFNCYKYQKLSISKQMKSFE